MSEEPDKTGAHGRTLTTMSPSGKVLIEGTEYGARLKSGWADAGEEVVVVGFDAFGLIVAVPDSPKQES